MDEHNHALAALRYLVASLDARRMVKTSSAPPPPVDPVATARTAAEAEKRRRAKDRRDFFNDPSHWTVIHSIGPHGLP